MWYYLERYYINIKHKSLVEKAVTFSKSHVHPPTPSLAMTGTVLYSSKSWFGATFYTEARERVEVYLIQLKSPREHDYLQLSRGSKRQKTLSWPLGVRGGEEKGASPSSSGLNIRNHSFSQTVKAVRYWNLRQEDIRKIRNTLYMSLTDD